MSNRALFSALALSLLSTTAIAGPPPGGRPASKGDASAFLLDGVKAGSLRNVDVPFATSDVVNESQGPSYFVKKHLGGVKYPDITFTVGADAGKPLRDWISASLQMNYMRKNGSIGDDAVNVEFFNALVTEVGFPAFDGTTPSKHVFLSVKLAPEYVRRTKGAAQKPSDPVPLESGAFRLEIDGLDTTKVQKIDAFTIKQSTTTDELGDARDYLVEPAKIEFPNLTFYVPRASGQSFVDWHEDFVIKGNCFEDKEKRGTLTILTADRKNVAFELAFFNMGIYALDEVRVDDQKLLKVQVYVEGMDLVAGPVKEGAAAGAPKRKIGKRTPLPGKPSFGRSRRSSAHGSTQKSNST